MTEQVTNETPEVTEETVANMEQVINNWRDSIVIKILAAGIHSQWAELLKGQGTGKVKNNAYMDGYLDALRDIHTYLVSLIPKEVWDALDETVVAESADTPTNEQEISVD